MNAFETKAAAMLAGRVVCGLRELTAEQRRHVLAHVQAEFCSTCGLDNSACRCFSGRLCFCAHGETGAYHLCAAPACPYRKADANGRL